MAAPNDHPTVFKFKLLAGQHVQDNPWTGGEEKFNTGESFASVTDLHTRLDQPGVPPKFEPLGLEAKIVNGPGTFRAPDEVTRKAQQGAIDERNKEPKPVSGTVTADKANAQAPVTAVEPEWVAQLDAMTFDELKQQAADEELDTHGLKTKADYVKALKAKAAA